MSTMENLVIRAARLDDLDQLMELSRLVGSGMTSMPSDEQSWIDKLTRSDSDFNASEPKKNGDIYFMVLEDLTSGEIVGSGAVYAGIGLERPFYSYKLATLTNSSEKLGLTVHARVLHLVNDFTGATEIGSLFLVPGYRRDGIGKFLSRSRFLLLADFPERFDEKVFAEMRGWLDEDDHSPFWDALGRKFFGLSFKKADFISAVDGFQFISDLMPKYPVYLDLLPESAQAVVGRPHDAAAPALKILGKEGFRHEDYVDIFDAGPTIQAPLTQISTVAASRLATLHGSIDEAELLDCPSYIISNTRLPDYRMTRAAAKLSESDGDQVELTQTTIDALDVKPGDRLRIVLERPAAN